MFPRNIIIYLEMLFLLSSYTFPEVQFEIKYPIPVVSVCLNFAIRFYTLYQSKLIETFSLLMLL